MPLAKIHVLEGQYNERRLGKVSRAVQEALISVLKIPSEDFFQIIHVLPRSRFLHTPSFLGLKYSDDFIVLEIAFIAGRPKETRLALLRELNSRIVAGAGISPDDLMIQLVEGPGENFSFGGDSQLTGSRYSARNAGANRVAGRARRSTDGPESLYQHACERTGLSSAELARTAAAEGLRPACERVRLDVERSSGADAGTGAPGPRRM